jgi:hypothetical protein
MPVGDKALDVSVRNQIAKRKYQYGVAPYDRISI